MRRRQQTLKSFSLFAVALIGAMALVGTARRAAAQSDCLAQFQDVPAAALNGGTITCTDCDAGCDQDVGTSPTANQSCTFNFRICVNEASATCVAGTLKKVKVVKKKGVTGSLIKPSGTSSACGAFTAVVKTKGKGKKAGTTKVKVIVQTSEKPKRHDTNTLVLECDPLPTGSSCATTTSTSTSTTSTTSTTIVCADCCGSFSLIKTLNGLPDTTVNVGSVVDDSGATLLGLKSGGLYFGGAGVGVPLPSLVPNTLEDANGFGGTYTKITACSGSSFTISPTAATDVSGSVHPNRHCSSAGVNNPEYPGKPGCLFGPPLAIPNPTSQATSTCVINRVSTSAAGTGKARAVPGLQQRHLLGRTECGPALRVGELAHPGTVAGRQPDQPRLPADLDSVHR
ncbi:MAG: hypothetical protein E6J77_24695 [Deltaproteobacteria bacterium]|nr:MAG: hypothetical protein E6J77_24695 [Deltaproteobacteria bacterium]